MRRALLLWLVLFGVYAATLGGDAGHVTAREGHRLLTAESIVSDGDLDLRDEYVARAWTRFHGPPLRPTAATVRGRLVEAQGIGFPLLIAPAYGIGGVTLVRLWLAALTALGFVIAAGLGRRLVPDPWASGAALVAGLSPPVLAAATAVSPEAVGATALAAAAAGALAVRDRPGRRAAFTGGVAIAVAPWLSVALVPAAAVCAAALARWLRRRGRGFVAFAAVELVLTSAVLFISINDRLFGGLTPYAPSVAPHGGTGAASFGDALARAPRLVGLLVDRDDGLLRWAPFLAMALVGLWLLWRSLRDRLALAVPDQVHVEVTAGFLAAVAAAQLLTATFLAPALHGAWAPARLLLPAVPVLAALAAWGWRHARRAGWALAALTLAGSVWMLAGIWFGAATLRPPRGSLPWGGVQDVLPLVAGSVGTYEAVVLAAAIVGVAALAVRERRARHGWGS